MSRTPNLSAPAHAPASRPAREARAPERPTRRYEPPAFEVIPLDCEITAYAPAGDEPLF